MACRGGGNQVLQRWGTNVGCEFDRRSVLDGWAHRVVALARTQRPQQASTMLCASDMHRHSAEYTVHDPLTSSSEDDSSAAVRFCRARPRPASSPSAATAAAAAPPAADEAAEARWEAAVAVPGALPGPSDRLLPPPSSRPRGSLPGPDPSGLCTAAQGDGLKEARPFNERRRAQARCGTQLSPASYDEVGCTDGPQGGGVMTLFSGAHLSQCPLPLPCPG